MEYCPECTTGEREIQHDYNTEMGNRQDTDRGKQLEDKGDDDMEVPMDIDS